MQLFGQGNEVLALRAVPVAAVDDGAMPCLECRSCSCHTEGSAAFAPWAGHCVLASTVLSYRGLTL